MFLSAKLGAMSDSGESFHVRLTLPDSRRDEVKLGLSKEELEDQFLEPYRRGQTIVVNGRTVVPDNIDRIRVSKSQKSASRLKREAKRERQASNVVAFGGPSIEWKAADRAQDITDQLIQGPPGTFEEESEAEDLQSGTRDDADKVFVVHGHDHSLKHEVEAWLGEISLDPVVLHREPNEGNTIIEKLEEHTDVGFALILVTPDDMACTRKEIEGQDSKESEDSDIIDLLEPRARQNVIFEWGYLTGKLGRENVCCLYKPNVELPSDLSGLLYQEVDQSIEEAGYALIQELKHAGLDPEI